jgi:hypothetical protein
VRRTARIAQRGRLRENENRARAVRAEPALGILDAASVVATRLPGWTTFPMQRTVPESAVSARVKFAFSSSVVQPTPASRVVTNAQPIAESSSVIASPAWTDPMTL